jgi:hypothetical protein
LASAALASRLQDTKHTLPEHCCRHLFHIPCCVAGVATLRCCLWHLDPPRCVVVAARPAAIRRSRHAVRHGGGSRWGGVQRCIGQRGSKENERSINAMAGLGHFPLLALLGSNRNSCGFRVLTVMLGNPCILQCFASPSTQQLQCYEKHCNAQDDAQTHAQQPPSLQVEQPTATVVITNNIKTNLW